MWIIVILLVLALLVLLRDSRDSARLRERTLRVEHVPQYGQFYLQDPSADADTTDFSRRETDELRLAAREGLIAVFVLSEFSEIAVELQARRAAPPLVPGESWDKVVEAPLDITSNRVVLAGCPDGPVYGKFGAMLVPNGKYIARIFYGGQSSLQPDGSTKDYYRIQLWPGDIERSKDVTELLLGKSAD